MRDLFTGRQNKKIKIISMTLLVSLSQTNFLIAVDLNITVHSLRFVGDKIVFGSFLLSDLFSFLSHSFLLFLWIPQGRNDYSCQSSSMTACKGLLKVGQGKQAFVDHNLSCLNLIIWRLGRCCICLGWRNETSISNVIK